MKLGRISYYLFRFISHFVYNVFNWRDERTKLTLLCLIY
jgi:hypothetical protein